MKLLSHFWGQNLQHMQTWTWPTPRPCKDLTGPLKDCACVVAIGTRKLCSHIGIFLLYVWRCGEMCISRLVLRCKYPLMHMFCKYLRTHLRIHGRWPVSKCHLWAKSAVSVFVSSSLKLIIFGVTSWILKTVSDTFCHTWQWRDQVDRKRSTEGGAEIKWRWHACCVKNASWWPVSER